MTEKGVVFVTGSTVLHQTIEDAPWRPQEGPEAFLELWGIDPQEKWAARFCALVRLTALVRAYGSEDPARAATRLVMAQAAVSPVIFWSRIKSTLAPVLAADAATLAAFGLTIYAHTAPALALALSLGLDAAAIADQEAEVLDRYGRR